MRGYGNLLVLNLHLAFENRFREHNHLFIPSLQFFSGIKQARIFCDFDPETYALCAALLLHLIRPSGFDFVKHAPWAQQVSCAYLLPKVASGTAKTFLPTIPLATQYKK